MAKIALTPEEEFGFIPDIDTSKQFDFQNALTPEEEFGFIPDEPVSLDPNLVEVTIDKSFVTSGEEEFDQVEFTNDVLSMPDLESLSLHDPSEPPTGEFAEDEEPTDKIGFLEALQTKAGRPMELLPFRELIFIVFR